MKPVGVTKQSWLLRGLALAGVLVVVRIVMGALVEASPEHGTAVRMVGLLVVVGVSATWGFVDGKRDRRNHPDPDHGGTDLVMMWMFAAIVAGLSAGLVCWILGKLGLNMGDNSLFFELVSGASWSLLLVLVGALAGKVLGAKTAQRSLPEIHHVSPSSTAAER